MVDLAFKNTCFQNKQSIIARCQFLFFVQLGAQRQFKNDKLHQISNGLKIKNNLVFMIYVVVVRL